MIGLPRKITQKGLISGSHFLKPDRPPSAQLVRSQTAMPGGDPLPRKATFDGFHALLLADTATTARFHLQQTSLKPSDTCDRTRKATSEGS